jgi:hypothetical protein
MKEIKQEIFLAAKLRNQRYINRLYNAFIILVK